MLNDGHLDCSWKKPSNIQQQISNEAATPEGFKWNLKDDKLEDYPVTFLGPFVTFQGFHSWNDSRLYYHLRLENEQLQLHVFFMKGIVA